MVQVSLSLLREYGLLFQLDTNYRPSENEILSIQEVITSGAQAAQHIDKQIEGILESIATLIMARDGRISSAKKSISATCASTGDS